MSITLLPPAYPAKTPTDKRIYSCSFATLIGSATLINAGTITIIRQDGVPMGAGDLAVGTPALDTTSKIVVATFTAGNVGVLYNIAYQVTASDGEIYLRTVTCSVTAALG